jgi:DNA polymerase I-like protein with 3'-5' exonuclease and polymerase domains
VGVTYGRTETGQPSFTKAWLDECGHPVAKMIVEAREVQKTYSTFLESYLGFSAKDGRVHTHFNQLRNDEGGTVSGRLSASNPNLQQVPARHEVIGPLVRGLFLPEEGQLWAANDFSSQEPRLLVHYATLLDLPGAEKMANAYKENPDTDFHQMVADMAGIKRKAAKTIGLGLMYGMGKQKLANSLDLPLDEASELIATFHSKVPFLKGTVDAVMKRIEHPASGGAIRTLLGRKCRFPLWEPMEWGVNKALPREQAIIEYGSRIKRAGTYKGLNRLIQGSAADQTKAGMVALAKAGFDIRLQVHDEIALSVRNRDEAREAADIMVKAVKLEVPSRVDVETGLSWGAAA